MNTNTTLKIILGTILIVGIIAMTIVSIGFSMNNKDKPVVAMSRENYQIQTHTIDSLTRVVDSLKMEIHSQAQKFDNTEKNTKKSYLNMNWELIESKTITQKHMKISIGY